MYAYITSISISISACVYIYIYIYAFNLFDFSDLKHFIA